ncbi:ARM repeat-containing [Pyrrhoderma noxium]|uniref:ARM repeat-containing n=1 Tax=Pyrrhoderma noxium TaxID=2282107 RepID=A0A286UW00_9AGAM|nr:ARM repeat-containing [Pyrrhoderma noxium]
MGDVLTYLKQTKHALIGNATNKLAFRCATGPEGPLLLFSIVGYINSNSIPEENTASSSSALSREIQIRIETQIRIEAANIITSLAHGSNEVLMGLLEAGAANALLNALASLSSHDPLPLKLALARALRALCVATADLAGPALWGLSENNDLGNDANAALDFVFQTQALDVYLPLLEDPSEQLATVIAQLIAYSVRILKHRIAITGWLPPDERLKESKGKRGWEVDAHSAKLQGGRVIRCLTSLITKSKNFVTQEIGLYAISALVKENTDTAKRASTHLLPEQKGDPSVLVDLAMHRKLEVKLAACLCIVNVIRSLPPHTSLSGTDPIGQKHKDKLAQLRDMVILILNSAISNEYGLLANRTKACHILSAFLLDDEERCKEAFGSGTLLKLSDVLTSITPTTKPQEWDDGEPKPKTLLREAALTALASISLFEETIRSEMSGSLNLLPVITICLQHPYIGVRYGAILCLRALSRSVSVLRTSILDSGAGNCLCEIIQKPDEDPRLINIAMTSICNLVNNFSPLRKTILEQGILSRLIEFARSQEPHLKLSAIWAIKNILYKATTEEKKSIMKQLGWDYLKAYLSDPRNEILEQALNICANIASSETDVTLLFDHLEGTQLMDLLADAQDRSVDEVTTQATLLLCNISNGSDKHRSYVLNNSRILVSLRHNLLHTSPTTRKAAVACVEQLANTSGDYQNEVILLKEAGVEQSLRTVLHTHSHNFHGEPQSSLKVDDIGKRALNALEAITAIDNHVQAHRQTMI